MKLNYRWSGCDWNEKGQTRVWAFPGNGQCIQYDIFVVDYDGDAAYWSIKVGEQVIADGDVEDPDEGRLEICKHLSKLLGIKVLDAGREFDFDFEGN